MIEIPSPQQLAAEGQAAYNRGDYLAAANAFEAASASYKSAGDHLSSAEMANNRSVALLQAGEAQLSLDAVLGTDEIFAGAGDIRRQAMALGNQAAALEGLRRLDEAIDAYERCAEILDQIEDKETRVSVMQALSALQLRRGRQLEALATMQAGLNGVKHPTLKQRMLRKLLQLPFKFMNH
jgi:tetratricopeptide (TPR) repeat protein